MTNMFSFQLYVNLFLILLNSNPLYSKCYTIGPNQSYPNPYSLYLADIVESGDTILIKVSTYSG